MIVQGAYLGGCLHLGPLGGEKIVLIFNGKNMIKLEHF